MGFYLLFYSYEQSTTPKGKTIYTRPDYQCFQTKNNGGFKLTTHKVLTVQNKELGDAVMTALGEMIRTVEGA